MKSDQRNKNKGIRAILTVLGIAIGVASVVLISEIGNIGGTIIKSEIQQLGFDSILISVDGDKKANAYLTENELEFIRENKSTKLAVPIIINYSNASMRGLMAKSAVWGIDSGNNQLVSLNLIYGRFLTQNDIKLNSKVCVIDENMAYDFYKRKNIVGKKIRFSINGIDNYFEIVGVVKSGGTIVQSILSVAAPYLAYVPYTTLQQTTGKTNFSQIAVKVNEEENIDFIMDKIVSDLSEKNNVIGAYSANNLSEQRKQLNDVITSVKTLLAGIAGISLVVSGLSIMTVMLIQVKERTKEIGIKKAVGARSSSIMKEFIFDSLKITLSGAGIGFFVAIIMLLFTTSFFKIPYIINFIGIIQILIFTLIIGVVFGVYPAYLAASLQPVDALQSE
ncbi:MAG: ABC transporter permease [Oscillospiraceae bacterium]